jgi:hypothetical protein
MCSCSAHPAAKPTVLPVCTSRRAGKSIGGTVYFRPVGGGSVFSELPIKRVLRRHVRFDDGRRRSDELWRFLGIPVEPSTSFTDRRGDHDVLYGPDHSGPMRLSRRRRIYPLLLGRQFPRPSLHNRGRHLLPICAIRRGRSCSGAGTFNLGDDDAGICRDGPPRQTPPVVAPRLTQNACRARGARGWAIGMPVIPARSGMTER